MTEGLSWTVAHLRTAATPAEVRTAVAEAAGQLGEGDVPASTVLSALEELALDAAKLRAELRTATRVREVLLASVAHDLRNPLNTFAMSAGLLRDDLEGPEFDRTRALNLLARMDRASVRMQGLIEDLLEASRVEAGTVEVTRKRAVAAVAARAAIAKARPLAVDKGANVEEGLIDEECAAEIDQARMIDALMKLVTVALKSTGEGGVIRIGVEHADSSVMFTVRASPTRGSPSSGHDGGLDGSACGRDRCRVSVTSQVALVAAHVRCSVAAETSPGDDGRRSGLLRGQK
jgi:signal transduction histidine kinase